MANMSNYLENTLVDFVLRGQVPTFPANLYMALYTAVPNDAGGGTEVSGGSYARVAIPRDLVSWSGTQAAGTTVASNGTGGLTSNNIAVNFPSPTANWGTIVAVGIHDAITGGNLLFHGELTQPKIVNSGDPASSFVPGSWQITFA